MIAHKDSLRITVITIMYQDTTHSKEHTTCKNGSHVCVYAYITVNNCSTQYNTADTLSSSQSLFILSTAAEQVTTSHRPHVTLTIIFLSEIYLACNSCTI